MALSSAVLTGRMRSFLMDQGAVQLWSEADLLGAARLALGEFSVRAGSQQRLEGLDGAAATSLGATAEGTLLLGACAYAALSRAVDRAENYELANESADLRVWAEKALEDFRALLERLYPVAGAEGSAAWQSADNAAKLARLQLEIDARAAAQRAAEAREDAAKAAEDTRLAGLRTTLNPAWGEWSE